MSEAPVMDRPEADTAAAEHVDVLIVGAGISGVSAGYHLQHSMPGTSFVMLEAQASYGGTWYTHKYPGIRSDSDLYTFGYRFKPWTGAPIATAAEIRRYMGEAIAENGLERNIRYRHKVLRASWSSQTKRWTVEGIRTDTGEDIRFNGQFPLDVPGLLPSRGRLHAGMGRHGGFRRPDHPFHALAGRNRPLRQAGRGGGIRCVGRHHSCPTSPANAPT